MELSRRYAVLVTQKFGDGYYRVAHAMVIARSHSSAIPLQSQKQSVRFPPTSRRHPAAPIAVNCWFTPQPHREW
jgi:hypothetical protein